MEITLEQVKKKFIELLNDNISREEVDRWAYSIIKEDELENVNYIPSGDKDKIWAALMYLYGIDLQDEPGEYLHSKEDINNAFKDKIQRYIK